MDEVEAVADMAEGVIIKAMNDGDAQMCRWWLAKKRRHYLVINCAEEFSKRSGIQREEMAEDHA
jgi:hypothetical protein